jgi:hypothetical protein
MILDLIAAHRLVTLTGAGGIGKMRLGLEVARRLLAKFADGAWAIELAPLSDPDFVPAAVARALGLDPADNVMSPERVANALAAKRLLLVLDKLRASVRRRGRRSPCRRRTAVTGGSAAIRRGAAVRRAGARQSPSSRRTGALRADRGDLSASRRE